LLSLEYKSHTKSYTRIVQVAQEKCLSFTEVKAAHTANSGRARISDFTNSQLQILTTFMSQNKA